MTDFFCQACQRNNVDLSFPYGSEMYHLCKPCFLQVRSVIQIGLNIEKQELRWMEAAYIGKAAEVNR